MKLIAYYLLPPFLHCSSLQHSLLHYQVFKGVPIDKTGFDEFLRKSVCVVLVCVDFRTSQ